MDKSSTPTLDYAALPAKIRWWEWVMLVSFSFLIFAIEALAPRLSPPRWPNEFDYVAMLMLLTGAIVLALATKLPHRYFLYYGFFGAVFILLPEIQYVLSNPLITDSDHMQHFLVNWIAIISASTFFCGAIFFLRLLFHKKMRRDK